MTDAFTHTIFYHKILNFHEIRSWHLPTLRIKNNSHFKLKKHEISKLIQTNGYANLMLFCIRIYVMQQ